MSKKRNSVNLEFTHTTKPNNHKEFIKVKLRNSTNTWGNCKFEVYYMKLEDTCTISRVRSNALDADKVHGYKVNGIPYFHFTNGIRITLDDENHGYKERNLFATNWKIVFVSILKVWDITDIFSKHLFYGATTVKQEREVCSPACLSWKTSCGCDEW